MNVCACVVSQDAICLDISPLFKENFGTSLLLQWLRIRLPTQGTQVRSLVQEDPTCRRAPKPVCHNY